MKNNRIVRAYDSINPTDSQKEKMLEAILSQAAPEEPPRKKRETVVYSAKPRKNTWRSILPGLAAMLAVVVFGGFTIGRMLKEPEGPSYMEPTGEAFVTGTSYDAVLHKYKTALEEGWSMEQCQIEDICGHITTANYSALDVSYSIVDLDGNGRDELVITNGQGLIWDLYTLLEDETPVHVHCQEEGWPVYRLYENGVICAESFESGKVYEYYVYQDGAFTGPEMVIRQGSGMFTYESAGEEPQYITEAEAEAKMAEYRLQELDLVSLLSLVSEEVAQGYLFGSNTAYAEILAKYNLAIAEGWSKERCANEGISLRMQVGYDVSKAGYVFLDLDEDGREEFIIAEESTDRTDNIWVLYTSQEDGTPVLLWVDEMTGGQCRLHEGNIISISDSYQDELEQVFYALQDGNLVMREMLQWEDEDTVFHTDAQGNTRQVTSREGQSISYSYENQKLNLTWLADIPDGLRDTEAAELYAPVLAKYRTALAEGWTKEQCQENDISPDISTSAADIGWCLMDINGNGTQELIISDGNSIYDLYALQGDLPEHVLTSLDTNKFTLCENGIFQEQVFFAQGSCWYFYRLSNGSQELQSVLIYDSQKENEKAYAYGPSENDLTYISKEEAGNIIFAHQPVEIKVTPIVENWDAETEDHPSEAAESTDPTKDMDQKGYDAVIDLYQSALQEQWDFELCSNNQISYMIAWLTDTPEKLGVHLMDLDGDRQEELLIVNGNSIYDMYTMKDGEPVQLFSGGERNHYSLWPDNSIVNNGSGSAFWSVFNRYILRDGTLILMESVISDYHKNPENPWFRSSDGSTPGEPLTQQEADVIMNAYDLMEIPATPVLNLK